MARCERAFGAAAILLLVGCGGDEPVRRTVADQVDAGDVLLGCPGAGEPVRVDVPPGAVVQTWLCDPVTARCTTIGHVLEGDRVEVPCTTGGSRLRRVRWVAPR